MTLDEQEDYETLKNIFGYFKPNIYFDWKKIVSLLNKISAVFSLMTEYSKLQIFGQPPQGRADFPKAVT